MHSGLLLTHVKFCTVLQTGPNYSLCISFLGTNSLMTMVVIGYDRYNVICKGFNGVKITAGKAFIILIAIWMYSTLGSMPPFLFGWGDYALGKKNFYKVLY